MIIILNGMTGSGKTSVGRSLSRMLKCMHIDLDNYIEMSLSNNISDIFAQYGEDYFREQESLALSEILLAGYNNLVLSIGGGTFQNQNNISLCLEQGIVVWLNMNLETLLSRLQNIKSRPLLHQASDLSTKLEEMLEKRTPNYEKSHIKVDFFKNYPTSIMAKQVLDKIKFFLEQENEGSQCRAHKFLQNI